MDMRLIPQLGALTYRRQYYDVGEQSHTKCSFCGNIIRFVFILKDHLGGSYPIGKCCFLSLREPNPDVYEALVASLILLRGQVEDTKSDTKESRVAADILGHEMMWKAARKAARHKIREYRKSSGEKEWLPKPLFDLRQELLRKPRQDYKNPMALVRWYERRASILQSNLSSPTKLWL
jgi:hypothetical protein